MKYTILIISVILLFSCSNSTGPKKIQLPSVDITFTDIDLLQGTESFEYEFHVIHEGKVAQNADITISISDNTLLTAVIREVEDDLWKLKFNASDTNFGNTDVTITVNYEGKSIALSFKVSIIEQNKTVAELLADAWSSFSSENYIQAINFFTAVKEKNPDLEIVYTGLGWSQLNLNNEVNALDIFNAGISKNLNLSDDFYAGLSLTLNANKEYSKSNDALLEVIETASSETPVTWVFNKDTSFTDKHLRLTAAQNYYSLSDFAKSLMMVKKLTKKTEFVPDLDTTDGLQALAAEIELIFSEL